MSRCYDVYFGQVKQKRFRRNKVNNNGGWLGESKIVEVEFKLV
jgi:hypothetical protein